MEDHGLKYRTLECARSADMLAAKAQTLLIHNGITEEQKVNVLVAWECLTLAVKYFNLVRGEDKENG
jgi:hypothetical protein